MRLWNFYFDIVRCPALLTLLCESPTPTLDWGVGFQMVEEEVVVLGRVVFQDAIGVEELDTCLEEEAVVVHWREDEDMVVVVAEYQEARKLERKEEEGVA